MTKTAKKRLPKASLKKKSKVKLSKEEKIKRREERLFKNNINTIFKNSGFTQIPTRGIEIEFLGITTELDNLYVYENILVVSEDTNSGSSEKINEHLRKKALMYSHFEKHQDEFIDFLSNKFSALRTYRKKNADYETLHYKLRFIYCSKFSYEKTYNKLYPHIKFLDYPYLRYFLSLSKIIQQSTKYELLKFLDLGYRELGIPSAHNFPLNGFLLPESPSGFSRDYKIVTFYIDPKRLIELCYVLRKEGGWRDEDALYQRLLIKSKIKSMRKYLNDNSRVFINNIIVTLPPNTKLVDENNETIKSEQIDRTKAQPVTIQIQNEFNSIGIIDGQHRIFSYHEGFDSFEKKIAILRRRQNLLVTGIIYPRNFPKERKPIFESNIFLEINDKQSRVKADLKQAIEAIVNPFEPIAISRAIISKLGTKGAMSDLLELHFFETRKIKTSSIVSYGLKYIVKIKGDHSLYKYWKNTHKADLANPTKRTKELLNSYIDFCYDQLNSIFTAYKIKLSEKNLFTLNSKVSRALSSTAINGIIFCFRKMLENDRVANLETYIEAFKKLKIDFSSDGFQYTSSHWKSLGEEIYDQCFG